EPRRRAAGHRRLAARCLQAPAPGEPRSRAVLLRLLEHRELEPCGRRRGLGFTVAIAAGTTRRNGTGPGQRAPGHTISPVPGAMPIPGMAPYPPGAKPTVSFSTSQRQERI